MAARKSAGKAGPKITRALRTIRGLKKTSAGKIIDRVAASRASAMLAALRAQDYGKAGRLADRINREAR